MNKLRVLPLPTLAVGMLALLMLCGGSLFALSETLELEAQAVGNYNTKAQEFNQYSYNPYDAMQKPSVGADYLLRAGSKVRDYGYLDVQARVAYDDTEESNLQFQLYNAFVNAKLKEMDIWAGHHKTPLGLSSYLDNHALIMMDNTMSALNYDRDWGVGVVLNRQLPSVSAAVTTGSGMPWYLRDNFLVSGRVGWWDYDKDNVTLGASAASGKVLRSMGYHIMHNKKTHDMAVIGVDASKRVLSFYGHGDLLYGEYAGEAAYSGLIRLGYNFLPEERANAEFQVYASKLEGDNSKYFSLGGGYKITPQLTLRGALNISGTDNYHTLVLQLYYLKGYTF